MATSNKELSLFSKLIKIQTELKAPKNQWNSFSKFKYRNAEDIQEALKPFLSKYELLLLLSDKPIYVEGWHYIEATATITDGKDSYTCQASAREEEHKKGADASQITGATSSYARKYVLDGMFLIDDTKDADAQAPAEQQQEQPAAPAAQPAPAVDLQPIRNIFKEFCAATGKAPQTATAEICAAVGAPDMASMTAAQVAKAVAAMQPIIKAYRKEQPASDDLASEDYQF